MEELEEKVTKPAAYPVNSENGCVTLSEIHFAELQRTIQSLKAQLEQRELACLSAKQVRKKINPSLQNTIFFHNWSL